MSLHKLISSKSHIICDFLGIENKETGLKYVAVI